MNRVSPNYISVASVDACLWVQAILFLGLLRGQQRFLNGYRVLFVTVYVTILVFLS
ncbi:MAG: hypothetical protein ABI623_04920 [bacterium]